MAFPVRTVEVLSPAEALALVECSLCTGPAPRRTRPARRVHESRWHPVVMCDDCTARALSQGVVVMHAVPA